jgi:two-component system nitrate/nitrite response regulator NarL
MPAHGTPAYRTLFFHASKLDRISVAGLLERNGFEVLPDADEPEDGRNAGRERGTDPGVDLAIFDLSYATGHYARFRAWCASESRVVVIADEFNFEHVRMAFRLGARGFFLYRLSTEALVPGLQLVMAGECVLPSELASLIVAEDAESTDDGHAPRSPGGERELRLLGFPGLQDRDIRVLTLVTLGLSNKEIARQLDTTEEMVKLYLRQIMTRINARNRTQAAVWAMQNGLMVDAEDLRRHAGAPPEDHHSRNGVSADLTACGAAPEASPHPHGRGPGGRS